MQTLGWEAEADFCCGTVGWMQWEPGESVSTSSAKVISPQQYYSREPTRQASTAPPRAPGRASGWRVVAKKCIFALLKAQL